eukprot:gb/GECG01014022.1/.p1 GENE.gb/GECG01014022.1/~~gb/GECG01014022.1/.p1  ORF type:complete len:160 (+),score=11.80 gb/GECG01014022.1/:1-480(+)
MIYVLRLVEDKYYIGYSKDRQSMEKRLDKHFEGTASAWTHYYTPVAHEETLDGDYFDEENMTLRYMAEHGIDNVRGGSFCTIFLSDFDRQRAKHTLRSIAQSCFYCGSNQHFAMECHVGTSPHPNPCKNCGAKYRHCRLFNGRYINYDLLPCETCGSPL